MGLDENFKKRMRQFNVRPQDVEESFIRSSGPGGQNVNKVSTCVCLMHIPSGIKVKCQKYRLQGLNRTLAWQMLLDALAARKSRANLEIRQQKEKIRRQKRPKPRALKERILAWKKKHSQKKQTRQGKIERS